DVCVVVGYRADMIRSAIGDRCHYIYNDRYSDTNSLYSLWLARDWVSDDFILINSDVLAHPQIFWHLFLRPGNALVYDSRSGAEEENMKVTVVRNKLLHISKSLLAEESEGESLGVLKFQRSAIKILFREAEEALSIGGENQWAPAAVERFCHKLPISCIDIAGLPWIEIDYVDDLLDAYTTVWPEVDKSINSPPYNHKFVLPDSLHSSGSVQEVGYELH
ncbi:Choline kinase, partial [Candidatus Methanophagaceae archaeon]